LWDEGQTAPTTSHQNDIVTQRVLSAENLIFARERCVNPVPCAFLPLRQHDFEVREFAKGVPATHLN
jgi:hypothetical protein